MKNILSLIFKPKVDVFATYLNVMDNRAWCVELEGDKLYVWGKRLEFQYIITPKEVKVSRGDDERYYPAPSDDDIWKYVCFK